MTSDVSFWDPEAEEAVPHVRDMMVGPASVDDALNFARRWHYSGTARGLNWRWGLWHGVTLHGVIGYNLPTRNACESVFGADHRDHVWHMSRLMLADISPRNSESRLIGGSLRAIEHEYPDVWGVLTYAAEDAGHIGTVYQATNAIYTGAVSRGRRPSFYLDAEGNRRGTYLNRAYVSRQRAAALGWTPGPPDNAQKHRYVYVLGNRTQRRNRMRLMSLPVFPYPKKSA